MTAPEIRTLADVPRVHGSRRADAVALRFVPESGAATCLTFAQLDERSCRVAQGLLGMGLAPASDGSAPRVAYFGRDTPAALEVLFGVARAGMVMVGLNWRLAPPEVEFILDDGEVALLFVDTEFSERAKAWAAALPGLRVIEVGTAFEAWRDAQSAGDPGVTIDPEQPAAQMYTSGTTGLPKGVVLPHRSFFAVVRSLREHGDPWIAWTAEDVSLSGIPLFHIGGIWWVATTLCAGATLVIIPSFSGPLALRALVECRVTKACFVPAMLQVLLDEDGVAEADVSRLGHVVYGGSPIPKPFLQKAIRVLGCGFAQIYGLTETGNTAVCLRPADHARDDLLQAAGRPYPGVRAKVIDGEGRELPPGEVGEICLHSPANMLGYWNRPEATASTLRDGWVHTGDAGHLDAEGYVFVSDRIKDMILYAGENVYPAEIESVLCEHPAVLEAAVIGVPDDRWGELVTAIVVRRDGHALEESELRSHCADRLADFKVPRSVVWSRGLPRTPSGKIKKAELRRPYWDGRERGVN